MSLCGVTFSSNNAHLVICEEEGGEVVVVETRVRKWVLDDHASSADLKAFQRGLMSLFAAHGVDRVAVKKCTTRGRYKSGVASIKMEAAVQLLDVEVVLIDGRLVTKAASAEAERLPAGLKKYQHDAFFTASVACST